MRKIAVIYSGSAAHYRTFHEPKYSQYIEKLIYIRDFKETSLEDFDVLIVPSRLNLKIFETMTKKINDFANNGGIVVVLGPQPLEWMPNQKWVDEETNFWWWREEDPDSGLNTKNEDNSLFKYISLESATWHQHGRYYPATGSEILIEKEHDGAILYIDKVSSKGTWIVTNLDPDHHFGSYFMPVTENFLEGLFVYLAMEEDI